VEIMKSGRRPVRSTFKEAVMAMMTGNLSGQRSEIYHEDESLQFQMAMIPLIKVWSLELVIPIPSRTLFK
jgi:hypothetical protein